MRQGTGDREGVQRAAHANDRGVRVERVVTPYTAKQLDALARGRLSDRERRLLAGAQRVGEIEALERRVSALIRERDALTDELTQLTLKEKTVDTPTRNLLADDSRCCPHCGRTKCFVRLMDNCGCLQCGRTWEARPETTPF